MKKKIQKHLTKEQALIKLQKYCAYQDRCHKEVRSKLLDLGMRGLDLENIIADLIGEKFLDEERFAKAYVRGKFRNNSWGRIKIKQGLKQKDISPYCIKKGMAELDEEEYYEKLENLIRKKDALLREPDLFKKKGKLAKYVMGKGYESFLIWEVINSLEFV